MELLTRVDPITAIEDEFVDPRPNLGVGGRWKIFVPPEVEREVVIEVGENDARSGVEREPSGDQGNLFAAYLSRASFGEVAVRINP